MKDFAYQAAFNYHGTTHGFICGAAIIHEKYLLTAAHCIELGTDPSQYEVKVGAPIQDDARSYKVSGVQPHPLYFTDQEVGYDLAIITLEDALELSDVVKPIRLAESDAVLLSGHMLNVSGWGIKEDYDTSKHLLYSTVLYHDLKSCRSAYDTNVVIGDSMICAGAKSAGGPCHGDSGGPLVADNILYGIVKGGHVCGCPNYPGIYTSVAYLRSWIYDQIGI